MSDPREISHSGDGVELVILPELGGRLHRLRVDGSDVLRTPDETARHRDDPFFWGAYPMAPWCNRAPAEPFALAGRTVRLAPNFPDGTAIHGLVYVRPWEARDDGSLRVAVAEGDGGWPWAHEVIARAAVHGREVTLEYELVNRSNQRMPAGIGVHPWFVSPVAVAVPATAVYPVNIGSAGVPSPVSDGLDLREARAPTSGLDGTWTRLSGPAIGLWWPHLELSASIAVEATQRCVAVATPADLRAIAVEPQTHGPDGFRRLAAGEPDAPCLLEPEESLRLGLRITFGPSARA